MLLFGKTSFHTVDEMVWVWMLTLGGVCSGFGMLLQQWSVCCSKKCWKCISFHAVLGLCHLDSFVFHFAHICVFALSKVTVVTPYLYSGSMKEFGAWGCVPESDNNKNHRWLIVDEIVTGTVSWLTVNPSNPSLSGRTPMKNLDKQLADNWNLERIF